ncbi:ATP-grasp domain-containing protein [Cellulomonas sp. H30R-01]|uniref:ATP-grasp domain-containing protein n=1 Tax=Cellulomonas sp. H30R-01 TaxID=2704467 RepID=UPI00138BA4BD|nr:ATP-grasp domain-containing protein [Cellulomonas sp. H30R-01]QHT57564.1 ATP-grasp domain-containing protein [Cellulomonas sp. H30R-01]
MSARVLLLGWKEPVLRELVARGADVTCVVEPARDVALPGVRVVRCGAPADAAAVVSALVRDGVAWDDRTHVLSAKEFPLVTAAVLARAAGASGMPVETAVRLRDKVAQKRAVSAAGVPTADTRLLHDADDLRSLDLSAPVVVKPVSGGGSHDTFVLRADDEAALERAAALTRAAPPVLVESYVDGRELHVDGVVRDGAVTLLTVSRYLDNLIRVGDGGAVGSVIQPPHRAPGLYRDAEQLTTAVLRAIGHADGIFHLEAFETPDGLVFGECAGRAGGGGIARAFRESTGVDLHVAWVDAALGAPAATGVAPADEAVGQLRLVPGPDARELFSTQDALALGGVVWADVAGAPSRDPRSGSDVAAGWLVAREADPGALGDRLRDLASWFAAGRAS